MLDAANDQNKIAEAAKATKLPLVGLVSPGGGVVGYVLDSLAEDIADRLNATEGR